LIRATSLRGAKSTTAKPLVSESCTKMRFGRAVGTGLDRHRAHAEIERQLPHRDFALEIDDGHELARNRAGNQMLAVRRHVDVVQPALDQDALGARQALGIDDVHRAGPARDTDQDTITVLGHRDIVGMLLSGTFLIRVPLSRSKRRACCRLHC
jgi:hypothetical protein